MKKFLLFITTIVLAIPVVAKADSNIEINCPSDSIGKGQSITCDVIPTADDAITNSAFTIATSNNLSMDELIKDSSKWNYPNLETKDGTTSVLVTVVSDANPSGTSLGGIKVTASQSANVGDKATISLSEVTLSTSSSSDIELNDITKELTIADGSAASNGGEPSSNGNGETSSSDNGESTNTNNPKTMDSNILVISMILVLAFGTVIIGKKKLNKLGK